MMPFLSPGWPACRRVHSARPGLPRVDNAGQGLAGGQGFEVLSASIVELNGFEEAILGVSALQT